ncbi:cell division ATP-binding protein FtsE [bacterium]|nr:cell division ATP-binding protein FtsE [bacterium]
MIQFHHVFMTYQNEYKALHDVTLSIDRGEFVMITGPSGAGKSTLIRLISRQILATKGQVIVFEQNVAKLKQNQLPYFRRKIGVVFQDFKLLYDRTVAENVAMTLHILGYTGRTLTREVNQALDRVGLTRKKSVMPWHLSGGEMQRVVLARAIVHDPPILLADEPTGNLDFATGWEMMRQLKQVTEGGTTVLCTTHNLNFIQKMKKRTLFLDKGLVHGERNRSHGN